jgi:class 3 adenylate cyclase
VFGTERGHATDVVRGKTVALHRIAADLEAKWRSRGHQLDFGVGLARGYATVGKIGFDGRCDHAAISTVANLSARLSDETDGGSGPGVQPVYSAIDRLVEA